MPSSVASDDSHNDVSKTSPSSLPNILISPSGRLHRRYRSHPSPRHWCTRYCKAQVQWLLHYRLGARSHASQSAKDQGLQRDQGRQGQGCTDEVPGMCITSYVLQHCSPLQPGGGGFQTAHELGQQRKRVLKISTGSKQLDTVLGGLVNCW